MFIHFMRNGWFAGLAMLIGLHCLGGNLPSGATVAHGEVMLNIQGHTMTLDQRTAKAIVNWDSFDIGEGYTVEIHQPSVTAAMLARVTGMNPSEIMGKLSANGAFYLVNPHGILFGSGAVVDVNRLLATTRMLSDQDFLAGRMWLSGESDASVANHGALQGTESVALVAQVVENHGVIHAPQSALLGAGQTVTLQNFGNGARLAVDFSGLGSEVSRVENSGVIEAPGGQAVLSASGGAGQVWTNAGKVTARSAEFSGRNSALSRLGEVQAEEIIIDPTANLIIGPTTANEAGLGYDLTVPGVGAEEVELDVADVQPQFTEGVGYGFHDADGNGWTYMRREANTLGGVLDSFSYLDPVLTYYNSEYLNAQLEQHGITLEYMRRGTTDGNITIADQVRLSGSNALSLFAEANLMVGEGVSSTNVSPLSLQGGRNVDIGDLTATGALAVTAGNQLISGHLEATSVMLDAQNDLTLSDGVKAALGRVELSGSTVRLGGELAADKSIQITANQVVSTTDNRLAGGAGIVVDGLWQAEHHRLDVVSADGDVRLCGDVRDASTVSMTAGGGIATKGVQATNEVVLQARQELEVAGAVIGNEVRLDSVDSLVRVNGDLVATTGNIVVKAEEDLFSAGRVRAREATFTGGGDFQVTGLGGSSVEKLSVDNDGAGAQVELNWADDLPELVITTSGDGSLVVANVGNIEGGRLSATGIGSDLELSGETVCLNEATTVAGNISLTGKANLTVGTVRNENSGNVALQSGSDLTIQGGLKAADKLALTAGGRIVLESQERLTSGGTMELTAADFDGGHTPLLVRAGGKLYLTAVPDTAETTVFARVEGASWDDAIHTRGKRVPGLVIYNGRVWMGRPEQMSKVDRAETSLFSRICRSLREEY